MAGGMKIPGMGKKDRKRVERLGDARRGLLFALGVKDLCVPAERTMIRDLIDRIQAEAEELVGEAARDIMDSSPIK